MSNLSFEYANFVLVFALQILLRNRATNLNARMNDGTTPMILAARLAIEGMVEELINADADLNATDEYGTIQSSPLYYFIWEMADI